MRFVMKYKLMPYLALTFYCIVLPCNALGQVNEQDVFNRARSVIDIVRTMRPDQNSTTADSDVSPRQTLPPRTRFSLSRPAQPSSLQPQALPKCVGALSREQRNAKVAKVFHGADYVFYDPAERASRTPRNTKLVPYSSIEEQIRRGTPDLRLSLAGQTGVRCLPTRVQVFESTKGTIVRYHEGGSAWKQQALTTKRRRF